MIPKVKAQQMSSCYVFRLLIQFTRKDAFHRLQQRIKPLMFLHDSFPYAQLPIWVVLQFMQAWALRSWSWYPSTCSIKTEIEENLCRHCGHCSTSSAPLPLRDIPSFAFCIACAVMLLNLCILASAEARTADTAFSKPEFHRDGLLEFWFDTELLLDVCETTKSNFWLLLSKPINGKLVSCFLGPAHMWSGANLCFKQWSRAHSRQRIMLEKVSISMQSGTGHLFFLVSFWWFDGSQSVFTWDSHVMLGSWPGTSRTPLAQSGQIKRVASLWLASGQRCLL